jgi:hypothetical protein
MHPDGGLWSITDNEGCGLVLDEIVTMFPSRDSVSLPPELQRLLNQFRKPDIAPVLISAPDWKRADVMIRECCQAVIESRPYATRVQRWLRLSKTPAMPWGWASYSWFIREWFDPQAYEEADESAMVTLSSYKRRRALSLKKRDLMRAAYDTHEGVELADHLSCPVCGGKTGRGVCKDGEKHRAFAAEARRQPLVEYLTPEILHAAGLADEAERFDELVALIEGALV